MQFATPDARAMYLDGFAGPWPAELENYYSPDQSEEVLCTTTEREEFETAHRIALAADVIIDRRDYDRFVRHLTEQCSLKPF